MALMKSSSLLPRHHGAATGAPQGQDRPSHPQPPPQTQGCAVPLPKLQKGNGFSLKEQRDRGQRVGKEVTMRQLGLPGDVLLRQSSAPPPSSPKSTTRTHTPRMSRTRLS